MQHIGKIIKKIRKEKNISINSIRTDIMDRTNYWRFENGFISTSSEKFLIILDNLNIDIEEFIDLYSTEEIEKIKKLKSDLLKSAKTDNFQECRKIGFLAEKIYKDTNKLKYLHLSEQAFLFSSRIDITSKDLYKPVNIQRYLGQCDTWNYYEIALFNNILFTFPLNDAILLGNRLILSLQQKQKMKNISDEDILIVINLISYCIEENSKNKAKKLIDSLSMICISESSTYSRIMLLWIKKVFIVKFEKFDETEFNQIFSVLELLEMNETLTMLQNWNKKLFE